MTEQALDSNTTRLTEDNELTDEPLVKVVHEITQWETSRPLVVHQLRGGKRLPLER